MSERQAARGAARRDARRSALVEAALAVFAARGVVSASVDEIVQAAGVAKGTFYLYFATKDDAVNAVAERMVAAVAEQVEAQLDCAERSPIEQLLTLGRSMQHVGDAPVERELIAIFHRPENRQVHDRISERILARLQPTLARIIADGIAAGVFRAQDPCRAAALVLSTFSALHHLVSGPDDCPERWRT